MLVAALFLPPTVLGTIMLIIGRRWSGGGRPLRELFGALGFTEGVLFAAGMLALLSVMLLAAAVARFRRARLILK